jgi:hypothetical protein
MYLNGFRSTLRNSNQAALVFKSGPVRGRYRIIQATMRPPTEAALFADLNEIKHAGLLK